LPHAGLDHPLSLNEDALRSEGLSSTEAARRLARDGPNELADRERTGLAGTLRAVATEPMFALLVVAAALYLAIGDLGEGLLLAAFALLTVGLVILQERRSERALDALRELAIPYVHVLRDGALKRLPTRDLVVGDAVRIDEGERVAADAVVRRAQALQVDESLLTGESVPVRKRAATTSVETDEAPGGEDTPHLYAGTLVVGGHGTAEVVRTGRGTHVGRIGASLASIDRSATPLESQLRGLVRAFGIAGFAVCTLLVTWYGVSRGAWLQGVLAGIAVGMAMLPEEFPMVLAVILGLGARRLAQVQVLARRPAVIEALGGATILCVDKTGTLTENRMRVRRLVDESVDVDLAHSALVPLTLHPLLATAALASQRVGVEPMDRAIVELADRGLPGAAVDRASGPRREWPLSPERLAVVHEWPATSGMQLAAKGAPEAIAELCRLDEDARTRVLDRADALAREGLRLLAVGEAHTEGPVDGLEGVRFRWLGLIGFEDPLRASVPLAVAEARAAGIAVAMVTGDHLATALAIAAQAGIDTRGGALTGAQIDGSDDASLGEAVRRVRVFARVRPDQKLRLVRALRAGGDVVAMTGDGINDAPALKAAHIGIAMGVRGTDVAREAASLVLLDEDFGRIVAGVRLGRRIFDNLRKAMTYIAAIHVPIAGVALLPLVIGWPPLMLPVHVVLTEMVIDPVCSLAFEGVPEDPAIMQRSPRRIGQPLIGWSLVWRGLLQGASLLVAVLAIDAVALPRFGEDAARTLCFAALTAGNLLLVWTNAARGIGARALFRRSFAAFWVVAFTAVATIAAALAMPTLRHLLRFAVVPPDALAISLTVAAAAVALATLATGRSEAGKAGTNAAVTTATSPNPPGVASHVR
jgi:Ca2+-transporting ATPase